MALGHMVTVACQAPSKVVPSRPVSRIKVCVQRRFGLKKLRDHITFQERSFKSSTMQNLFMDMAVDAKPHEIVMPLDTCIIKHIDDGGFEFVLEQPSCIKHYIFEDV